MLEVRKITRARDEQLGTHRRVLLGAPVDEQHLELVARELDRDRETDRSRADDRYIELLPERPPKLWGQARSRQSSITR